MDYSEPYAPTPAVPGSYVSYMLETLGDGDPWKILPATVERIGTLIADLDADRLRMPESPGKWSAAQVVQHLADTELLYGYRLRVIATHERPLIQGIDQDLWAEGLDYANCDIGLAIEQLQVLRRADLKLLGELRPEQWKRVGIHAERGPEDIELLFRLMAAHDVVHLRQIERILRSAER